MRRGFRYRAYAMAPLDATEFSAEEGLRGGAQHGAEAQVRNVAVTGRLEYVGVRGLQTGVSFWRGDTGFNVPRHRHHGRPLRSSTRRYSRGRLETRGQYAHVFIGGAGALNDADDAADRHRSRTSPSSCAASTSRARTACCRAASPHDAAVFVRYENFDTQFRMPAGSVKLPQFDRDAWVVGATYWVDPDVAIKFDYSHVRSQSESCRRRGPSTSDWAGGSDEVAVSA